MIESDQAFAGTHAEYTYDEQGRLVHRGAESAADIDSVQPGLQQHQQYDAAGNRIDSESYVGEGNRLVQDAQFSYDYDKQGNLLKKLRNDNGDTWQYKWDPHGRLLKVTFTDNGNGGSDYTVHYGYDALGRQVTKKIDGDVDSFLGTVWDGALRQFELDLDTGAVENSYFHGPSGDLLAVDQGESVWAFSDLSGTTRSLGIHRADPAPDGHWDVAHRQYDDFGEQRPFAQSANDDLIDESGNGISANADKTLIGNDVNLFESVPEFFQGSQWDAQAELYTLGGSYYDPFTGRYVQDTGGENGYVFSGNSPNRDRVSLPTNFDFTSQDYANIYGTGVSGTFNYLVGEGFRATLGDDYLAQAENYELVAILTAGATAGVVAGIGATTAAAAYGLGVFSTALLVGAASGGAEYLGLTTASAAFGGNGPTAGGLAASTLGGAAGGGLLHGAGLLATPVARAGLSGARTAVTTASNFVYDTGVPFARGFGRALANGPVHGAVDPSSAAFSALGRGIKGGLREVQEGALSNRGADLTIARPAILNNTSLTDAEQALVLKSFRVKVRALQSAARRGELTYSPGTDAVRVSELQAAYRARIIERYQRMFGTSPNLSRLDADHPVDLVVGGAAEQRLKLIHRSVNRSIGSSLRNAAESAGLKLGDVIRSINIDGGL